ncbi:MAG: serine hydroxymethyltransferase, partial [Candidatus Brocadiia bacterium]|nr:serine hydroxymethyltransferase [Candidatus Brocadiia bacterium]
MSSFPFAGEPDKAASDIVRICAAEQERQWQRLVMIPSETICHPAAAAVLGGALGHIYAEGLPKPILCHDPRPSACDEARFQSWRTRLSDRRFYKGTVNADRVELVAHKRIAEVFAALEGSPSEAEIYVNVQALSGAAANLAVYEALLEPGDRIVGLDLAHGGHLTHGSEFNVSGKRYEAHSYGVDPATRRLDYGQVRERVREIRPRLIIGGASGYSWDFDWAALREIADEAGAYLLADVAHLAGLVAAGVLNNPLPHAHVVTFTTHKTLCGPRGAVILTTDPQLAGSVDGAVFPGMQGGPHMNSIAAIARLFELIQEDCEGFRKLQRRIVDNTQFFAECLAAEGFTLEYGGTNTHMLLVDLKEFPVEGETCVDGEIGSRLLEIAGIVCNKNVIPGDSDGAHASGLRFGLPWLTQRGVSRQQLSEIAAIVNMVLSSVRTITVWSRLCEQKCRGRVPPGLLDEAAERTLAIAESLPYPAHSRQRAAPRVRSNIGDRTALLVRGDKVRLALDQMLTARLPVDSAPVHAWMLEASGAEIDDVIAVELEPAGREERWLVLPHEERAVTVRRWIEDLSDGYLLFDDTDLQQKVDGPSVVEEVDTSALPSALVEEIQSFSGEPPSDPTKPYFIG